MLVPYFRYTLHYVYTQLVAATNTSTLESSLFPMDLSIANILLANTIVALNASFEANNVTAGDVTVSCVHAYCTLSSCYAHNSLPIQVDTLH